MPIYKVTLIDRSQGTSETIDVPDDRCITDVAKACGIEVPIFCRTGECSSCVGKLISGKVDQSAQAYLGQEQLEANFVLTCVAYPLSDCIIQTHVEEELL